MALNFPNSPSTNDEYSFGGKTWIYTGSAWKLKTDGAINDIPIGNTTPSSGAFTTLSATGTFTGTTVEAAQIGNSGATLTGTLDTAAQTNITSVGTLTGLTLSGNLDGTNINAASIGNSGATLTGTLQTAAQTNITSLGTLTGLTLSGTLTGTTINAATIGNTDAAIIGNGSQLTSLTGANVTGTVANATYADSAGSAGTATSADTAQYVTEATQSNITAVGTLTSLTVTGNVSAGNLSATGLAGTLSTAAQTNITSLGTLTSLTVTGNVSAGNVSATGLAGTLSTAAQTNVTSLGTLTGLTLSGTLTGTTINAATIGNSGASLVGSLTGDVTGTAAAATTVETTVTGTSANYYIPFSLSGAATGNASLGIDSGLYYNPGSNGLTSSYYYGSYSYVTYLYPTGIYLNSGSEFLDLVDSATVRFGSSDDTKLFYDGVNNTFEMELEAGAQSFIITDNGTTRFTFEKATGNLTAGNVSATAFTGDGSALTSITGANVTGTVANATYADSAGSADSAASAILAEYVTQSNQANITSVGSSLTTAEITIGSNAITSTHDTITIEPAAAGSTGNVVIEGNLRVTGNVTYIDSETITTNDLDIMVANNQTTSLGIDGAGIIAGNVSNVGIATFTYDHNTTSWQPNVGITPAANASLNLGGTSNYWNNGYFAAITAPSITGTLTGDVTGDLTGTAAAATTVETTLTSTSSSYYIPFSLSGASTGNASLGIDSGLYYNPSSNYLYISGGYLIGSVSGSNGLFSSYVALTGDDDYIRWGADSDAKMFYDGVNSTMEMELEADAQSFIITDNGTTRFTFEKSNGNLTLNGNVNANSYIIAGDGVFWANGDAYSSGSSSAGGYFNSSLTSFPGSAGDYDYGSGESYVGANSSTDAFGITTIEFFDMHDPEGSIVTVDLGSVA